MRKWRVGTVSMGILLVATGILLLAGEFQGFSGVMLILRWWPAILIILGVEVLAYIFMSRDDQPKVKFDGFSIFLTIMIVLVSTGVYATHSLAQSDLADRFFDEVGFYKHETAVTKSFEVEADGVEGLEIENSHGDVQVESYDGTTIKIDAFILIRSNDERAAAEMTENMVGITEGKTTIIKTMNEGLIQSSNRQQLSVDYSIRVPKELTYDIKNKFGDINLENLTGDIQAEAGFGSVKIGNIQGDLRLENSHGEAKVRDIFGRVEIDNQYGQIFFSIGKNASKDITIKNQNGDITVDLAENQQGSFKAVSRYGQISLDDFTTSVPEEVQPNRQQWEEIIGAESPRIYFEADHGNISIKGR